MSNNLNLILKKLTSFIKRYYINELIKGTLLFLAIGLLYFLVVLLLENFLWLSPQGRKVLFLTFIGIEALLFVKFIGISLAKLVKFGKQITAVQASAIIGNHFPEVNDQLVNLLQLRESSQKSELLEASIEQKSAKLSPVPFSAAINFKKSFSYAKYALIPLIAFLLFTIINGKDWFGKSLTRVVNYNTAYEPPAPFHFKVLNESTAVIQQQDFTLNVTTYGTVVPNQIAINFGDETYFLNKKGLNKFSYTFKNPANDISFKLTSGKQVSNNYKLLVNKAPSINTFQMLVSPPAHVGLKNKTYKNTGNATVAEGSKISWIINSINATKVSFSAEALDANFMKNNSDFSYKKQISKPIEYEISTSNKYVDAYEKLAFSIDVIKDKSPIILVDSKKDTLQINSDLFYGQLSDDYGLRKLDLVYFKQESSENINRIALPIQKGTFSDFTYQFPNDLKLEDATSYSFYFEVFDNDSYKGSKSSKSKTFNYRQLSRVEEEQSEFKSEQQQLHQFSNSLDQFQKSELDLESFSKLQKQQSSLSFKEKQKLSSVLEKQAEEQKSLEKLSKKLNKTLDKLNKDENSEAIKEQLERTKKELKKNQKLIDEIKKALEKLTPKELQEKVDELQKDNKKLNKNLSQVLELTKRYYVIDKHQRIVKMLELLSEKENKLADSTVVGDLKNQKQINTEWKIIQNELNNLRKHNSDLKKPMNLDDDPAYEEKINDKLNDALDNLEKQKSTEAKKKQKISAVMLKNLADKMGAESAAGQSIDKVEEDLEMLRQILDNLVLYSLNQEENMNAFKKSNSNDPNYSVQVRRQNVLKEHFEHIDDSLFAVSSRNPKIGTKINDIISDIDYDLKLAIEKLTDNYTRQGTTSLQFAVSHSNDLALMLSHSLQEIDRQSKPGKGKGKKAKGFQLPDIIKKQESLNKAMQQMIESKQKQAGNSKKQDSGGEKKSGDKGKEGKEGENGKKGKDGKKGEGQSGEKGKGEKSGKEGKTGQDGESGQGQGQGKSGEGQGNKSGKNAKQGKGKEGKNGSTNSEDGKGDKDSKEGKGKGKKGNNGKSSGDGEGKQQSDDESDYEELFEIYKQQQNLRNQLENRLQQNGISPDDKRILIKMEQVENKLLEQGFTEESLKRMLDLKHQLFKLNKAQFQQGRDKKRKSKTNEKEFRSENKVTPSQIKQYFNTTEILNRQVLPLQPEFRKKVQEYFINTN